jgi:hypothetical protein
MLRIALAIALQRKQWAGRVGPCDTRPAPLARHACSDEIEHEIVERRDELKPPI